MIEVGSTPLAGLVGLAGSACCGLVVGDPNRTDATPTVAGVTVTPSAPTDGPVGPVEVGVALGVGLGVFVGGVIVLVTWPELPDLVVAATQVSGPTAIATVLPVSPDWPTTSPPGADGTTVPLVVWSAPVARLALVAALAFAVLASAVAGPPVETATALPLSPECADVVAVSPATASE